MNKTSKKISIFVVAVYLCYILGFLFLYPLFSSFTAGSTYDRFVAYPAQNIHYYIYEPTMQVLGKESLYTKLWLKNADIDTIAKDKIIREFRVFLSFDINARTINNDGIKSKYNGSKPV